MFGEEFGLDYYQQRHVKLVKEAEEARLVRRLEAMRRSERSSRQGAGLHRRVLAATGGQLVRLGRYMQQAAGGAHGALTGKGGDDGGRGDVGSGSAGDIAGGSIGYAACS